jgi:hypothetical protein
LVRLMFTLLPKVRENEENVFVCIGYNFDFA